ncbi:MAG TPA: MlrC C-terminal domain-containing protein, partial [Pirellulaceae bacterium]|nr:MlrC C-terminal domain-containing protein [Pirellulaceae bacterium]
VTPSFADVEGEFLERLRALPGARELPVFGVFDLHANFSLRMATDADCLVAYRENPHTDACAMAAHGVELLQATLCSRQRPRTYWRSANVIWPPSGTDTADAPMRELEALARQCELHPDIVAVNVCGGFAFADTPDTGVSFTVVTTGAEQRAREILAQLCARAWELRAAGIAIDRPVSEVIDRLRAQTGLIVIAEPSDNIGGGAPGDGTGLLRALVEHHIHRSAICICDAQAVRQVQNGQVGERLRLAIGGRGSSLDAGPLELDVELLSRNDGHFQLEDPHSHLASMFGNQFDMGPCAVVRHEGVTILLTSHKTPPFDLGQWRSQGIEPTECAVLGVKAAVAHRRVYAPIAAALWSVETPGPCRSDLRRLPYRHLRRPKFPLDVTSFT